MRTLAEHEDRIVVAAAVDGDGGFVDPFPGHQFPCLLWDHDGRLGPEERAVVARRLIETGCRYAVCGGINCEAWHDAIDLALVLREVDEPDEARDAVQVMTSWHDGEPPDEVAFFLIWCTDFGDECFTRYLVLHVGSGPLEASLERAVRLQALDE